VESINAYNNRYLNPLEIGSDFWGGVNSTILRGVKVGHGAVIDADSIINKDAPCYAIVAGNTANVIKYKFDKNIIEILLKLK